MGEGLGRDVLPRPGRQPGVPPRQGLQVCPDDVADVGVVARVGGHGVVAVVLPLLPGRDDGLGVGRIGMQHRHNPPRWIVEHGAVRSHRPVSGVRGGRGEEGLELLHGVALVVEHGPAAGRPAVGRFGADFALDPAAEAVAVRKGALCRGRGGLHRMDFPGQGRHDRRGPVAGIRVMIVHDAHAGSAHECARRGQRVGHHRLHLGLREVDLEAVEPVTLARGTHGGGGREHPEHVVGRLGAVSIRVGDGPWRQHAVVHLRARAVTDGVGAARGIEQVRVVLHARDRPERAVEAHGTMEVPAGRCQVAVTDRARGHPPAAVHLDVASGGQQSGDVHRVGTGEQAGGEGLPIHLVNQALGHHRTRRRRAGEIVAQVLDALNLRCPKGRSGRGSGFIVNGRGTCQSRGQLGHMLLSRQTRQLVGRARVKHRDAVVVRVVEDARIGVVGDGGPHRGLFGTCAGWQCHVRPRSPVGHLGRPLHLPVVVDFQSHHGGGPGVAGLAFGMNGHRFRGMGQEHGMRIESCRLEHPYGSAGLLDLVGVGFLRRSVEAVDLLPQHRAAQRPVGLSALLVCHRFGQVRLHDELVSVVLAAHEPAAFDPGMEPGLRQHWWHREGPVLIGAGVEDLAVVLVNTSEATELPLVAVVVAVVVGVRRAEHVARHQVAGDHRGHDMDREGQPRDPRRAGLGISQVLLGGGLVGQGRRAAQVVADLGEQVRFAGGHQRHVAHRGRDRGRPDQAGGAIAEQIDRLHVPDVLGVRHGVHGYGLRPRVPAAVEEGARAIGVQVQQVGGATAVDVRQTDPLWVEVPHARRVGHDDRIAEVTVAAVGPVPDITIGDPDDVGEAVARHVSQEDAAERISETRRRRRTPRAGRSVAVLTQRRGPVQGLSGQSHGIGQAVPGHVREAVPGVVKVDARPGCKRPVRGPVAIGRAFVEPGRNPGLHKVQTAVAGEVHEPALGVRRRPLQGGWPQPSATLITPVPPASIESGQASGQALPVEVNPGRGAVEVGRGQRLGGVAESRRTVVELQPWHRCTAVTGAHAAMSAGGDGGQKRVAGRGVVCQTDVADERAPGAQLVEPVEHQDALAASVGPDLESGPIGGEAVRPHRPRLRVCKPAVAVTVTGWIIDHQVLAVVQNDLEHPLAVPVRSVGWVEP